MMHVGKEGDGLRPDALRTAREFKFAQDRLQDSSGGSRVAAAELSPGGFQQYVADRRTRRKALGEVQQLVQRPAASLRGQSRRFGVESGVNRASFLCDDRLQPPGGPAAAEKSVACR